MLFRILGSIQDPEPSCGGLVLGVLVRMACETHRYLKVIWLGASEDWITSFRYAFASFGKFIMSLASLHLQEHLRLPGLLELPSVTSIQSSKTCTCRINLQECTHATRLLLSLTKTTLKRKNASPTTSCSTIFGPTLSPFLRHSTTFALIIAPAVLPVTWVRGHPEYR